jgi:hypothetical protein
MLSESAVSAGVKVLRHWVLTPDVFPQRRESATGAPGGYPDRTHTASDDELTTTDQPPTRSTSCLLKRSWVLARQG